MRESKTLDITFRTSGFLCFGVLNMKCLVGLFGKVWEMQPCWRKYVKVSGLQVSKALPHPSSLSLLHACWRDVIAQHPPPTTMLARYHVSVTTLSLRAFSSFCKLLLVIMLYHSNRKKKKT